MRGGPLRHRQGVGREDEAVNLFGIEPQDVDRVAKAIHRQWCRHTIKRVSRFGEETDDEAHERRWRQLPDKTRAEFMREGEAAIQAARQAGIL